ncbi:MAG: hypothetical protein WCI36_00335 [bacterium]
MKSNFYYSTQEDPFFIEVKSLLKNLTNDVRENKPLSAKRAVRLMHLITLEIPVTSFKDHVYTKQVLDAIELFLQTENLDEIKKIARKRKTDRLEMRRAIACDAFEYFSFLPMQLLADPGNIHRYQENIDMLLWLLRKTRPNKNCLKILSSHIARL